MASTGGPASSIPATPLEAEYLYWVGCAGSFDDKNKKVTQAMAKLLRRAGIDVAILGPSEMCTGDSARRSGNEYLFQMLAHAEHRDARRHGREEDHHPVPALLQHAAERVPPARRQLRGRAPHAAARTAHRLGPTRRVPGDARRAHHLPRLVLPRSAQRRLPRAPQGRGLDQGRRGRRDAAQRHQGHVLRCRRGPHVDGGGRSARRSTTSVPPRRCRPVPAASRRPARSATS